jgi:hypothetical protein
MEGIYHTKYLRNRLEDTSKTTDLSLDIWWIVSVFKLV